ncbi:MAG: DJ-1 family glyoxalase III [Planctomycetota bacterium]
MAKSALVVLAAGFEEIEAVTVIDVLRRAGVEVTAAAVACLRVDGSHGLPVVADATLADVKDKNFDAVILPGGMPGSETLGGSGMVKEIVLRHHKAGRLIAAICAAPACALAPWGVLDGRTATCYPGMEGRFSPKTRHSRERVVADGNLVTSQGPGTALAFALELAKRLAGPPALAKLTAGMLIA